MEGPQDPAHRLNLIFPATLPRQQPPNTLPAEVRLACASPFWPPSSAIFHLSAQKSVLCYRMKPTRLEPVYHRFSLLGPSFFLVACWLYACLAPEPPSLLLAAPLVYSLVAAALFLLQEAAFLFAAKLLGFGPYSVFFGVGGARASSTLWGTRVAWSSPAPLVSYWLGSTSPSAFRLRLLLLSMVRPLSALAALLYVCAVLVAPERFLAAAMPAWAWSPLLHQAALLALFVELLRLCWASTRFDAAGGAMFSNRYLLRKALWLTPAKIHSNIEHAYSLETNLLIADKKFQEAKQTLFAAIDRYPHSLPLRKSLILVAFYVEDYASARKHAQQLLQLPVLSPEDRFTLHYQSACAALMSGDLDAARQEAEMLRAAAPEYLPTQCLLGAIAIQQGQLVQGAAIVEKVLAQDKATEVQAECYAWLSIAASKCGDLKRAEALLHQAQRLHSREQTVRLALQELQEARLQETAANSTPYRA